MSRSRIAILTDFGHRDGYVGVMKGVILGIHPDLSLVDVAHEIPAQDVWHGSWVLDNAFDFFPEGTFFLCVVDPHVGCRKQKQLAFHLERPNKGLILPDNGLATRVLNRYPDAQCVTLENRRFFRDAAEPSSTFHGRDIYAPVAAHLAEAFEQGNLSLTLASLGPTLALDQLCRLKLKPPEKSDSGMLKGQIDVSDTYGNLVTNIPSGWMPQSGGFYQLKLAGKTLEVPFVSHYSARWPSAPSEAALALVEGSHGMIEICAPQARAVDVLQVSPGTLLQLSPLS